MMRKIGSVTAVIVLLSFVLDPSGFFAHGDRGKADQGDIQVKPFMVFAVENALFRVDLDGANLSVLIQDERSRSIQGLTYHYRRGLLYWSLRQPNVVKVANLEGINIRTVADSADLEDIVDLGMDWINDKLYWIDRLQEEIVELDIATNQRKIVGSTSCGSGCSSRPQSMAIFPTLNATLLWWVDKTKRVLDTTTISPSLPFSITTQASFHQCSLLGPLYANPTDRRLYMMEKCGFSIDSVTFKGSNSVVLRRLLTGSISTLLTYRMSMFGRKLYWAVDKTIYSLDVITREVEDVFMVNISQGKFVESLVIVHPSLQPAGLLPAEVCPNSCYDRGRCELHNRSCVCFDGSVKENCLPDGETTTLPNYVTLPASIKASRSMDFSPRTEPVRVTSPSTDAAKNATTSQSNGTNTQNSTSILASTGGTLDAMKSVSPVVLVASVLAATTILAAGGAFILYVILCSNHIKKRRKSRKEKSNWPVNLETEEKKGNGVHLLAVIKSQSSHKDGEFNSLKIKS